MASSTEQKIIKTVQHVLLVGLVLYAAYLSAQAVWYVFSKDSDHLFVLSENKSASVSSNQSKQQDVARYHLFGKPGVVKAVKKDVPVTAPKTRLRLRLKGVFTAEQPKDSGAIVEEQGKKSNYYRVGDVLPGNATLEEVFSDRVLLRRSGKLETLYFEDSVSGKNSGKIARAPAAKRENKNRVDTPEQFMQEATRRLAKNPEQALRSVGLSPGKDGGYVYQGNNPMLSGLNLKKGDVIRSVNGNSLGDIQKDRTLMESLYEQGNLEVEVVRDGASFFINYPLR